MRPASTTQSGVGRSAVIPLNHHADPFNVGLHATVTAPATYTVEYTADDPFAAGFNPATATWFPVTGLSGLSAAASVAFAVPARAVSIAQTAGAGSTTLTIIQAG